MSLGERDSLSPPYFPSVNSYDSWIPRDFPDDIFAESSLQQPLYLTPEEERLFRSFGDDLDNDLEKTIVGNEDFLDEKQAVYAEAHAAGLVKGGLRRAAFSMGDLQALQPQIPVSASNLAFPPRLPHSASGGSRAPALESVPESKALPNPPSTFSDDMGLNSGMPERMSTDILDGISLDQLSAELATSKGGSQFDTGIGSIFGDTLPLRLSADMDGLDLAMPMAPAIKSEPGLDEGMRGFDANGPLNFGGHMSSMDASGAALGYGQSFDLAPQLPPGNTGFFNWEALQSMERKPPLPPRSPPGSGGAVAPKLEPSILASTQQSFRDLPGPSKGPSMMTTRSTAHAAEGKPSRMGPDPSAQKKPLHRSQSALELRSMARTSPSQAAISEAPKPRFIVELTTPEGHIYTAGRLSNEERAQKILRYRQKRHERNFNKRIKYMCRKTLADSRPRVRGRFARNDDAAAVMPHETKKALAEKAKKERKAAEAAAAEILRAHDRKKAAALAASRQPGFPSVLDFSHSRSKLTSDLSDLIPMTIPHVDSDPSLSTETAFNLPLTGQPTGGTQQEHHDLPHVNFQG